MTRNIPIMKLWKQLIKYAGHLSCQQTKDGKLIRLWEGYSATTGRHIKAFAGITGTYFKSMNVQEEKEE